MLERSKVMPHDDAGHVAELLKILAAEGVMNRQKIEVASAHQDEPGIILGVVEGGQRGEIRGSHLLVATGRRPRLEALDLDKAGVKTDAGGRLLRTGQCKGMIRLATDPKRWISVTAPLTACPAFTFTFSPA